MPELKRNRWTWPKPSNVPFRQWYQVESLMAAGLWEGRSFVFGRAVTYGVPAGSDGTELRHGQVGWHPDYPIPLTAGHEGEVMGTAVWAEDTEAGLYVLWEVRPDHLVEAFAAATGSAGNDLSVGTIRPGEALSDQRVLDHVAVVDAADYAGSQVYAVATPWDVYVRWAEAGMVRAGHGPAAYEPVRSTAEILADLEGDLAGDLVATRSAGGIYLPLNRLELRRASGGRATLSGVCMPYDSWTHKAGARPEVFRFGAFAGSLEDPVKLYGNNHDRTGRPAGAAVKLVERRDGLHGTFKLFDTTAGRDALTELTERTYGGLSVGFCATRVRDLGRGREVLGAELHHVSLVDEPAYDDAVIYDVSPADLAPRIPPKAPTPELAPV